MKQKIDRLLKVSFRKWELEYLFKYHPDFCEQVKKIHSLDDYEQTVALGESLLSEPPQFSLPHMYPVRPLDSIPHFTFA